MNKIIYKPKAIKQLAKIPERNIIKDKCRVLAQFPAYRLNTKALNHHKYDYRLRVGRFRIFFNYGFEHNIHIIHIEEVKKRDDNTYSF